ncbi:hypothetical protein PanWU01x14_281580 [Parasponia andersonii]|uniref:Uncharacterized protein n=1 Tax=Parasponia andersonii TaxID=3476 RepID=A0A2P5B187_PARAD|nr:hypothetical protein PanWU01x14_281580 [Parasponia andersonii]
MFAVNITNSQSRFRWRGTENNVPNSKLLKSCIFRYSYSSQPRSCLGFYNYVTMYIHITKIRNCKRRK